MRVRTPYSWLANSSQVVRGTTYALDERGECEVTNPTHLAFLAFKGFVRAEDNGPLSTEGVLAAHVNTPAIEGLRVAPAVVPPSPSRARPLPEGVTLVNPYKPSLNGPAPQPDVTAEDWTAAAMRAPAPAPVAPEAHPPLLAVTEATHPTKASKPAPRKRRN